MVLTSTSDTNSLPLKVALTAAIATCARQLGKPVDRLRLHDAINSHSTELEQASELLDAEVMLNLAAEVSKASGVPSVELIPDLDPARLPCMVYLNEVGFGVVLGCTPKQEWVIATADRMINVPIAPGISGLRFIFPAQSDLLIEKPVFNLFKRLFIERKTVLVEACVASVFINLIALFTSIYSMQVYDRVIPTQGYSTLAVLTFAVLIAMVFDLLLKLARSHLMKYLAADVDKPLSRAMFARLLQVRLDVLPASVGSLSAQIRGYETIRGFLSATTFYFFVDLPFAVFFIALIAIIGVPLIAIIPFLVLLLSLLIGGVLQGKITEHAKNGMDSGNRKTGLLVEAIEGAETIKSGGSSWGALSKWIDVNADAVFHENELKHVSELTTHISALMQQISYVGLVALGAYVSAEGHMTMGALIACSILSGRALMPLAQIPNVMVQAAHSIAALKLLEKFYQLEIDNHGVERPLVPENVKGEYFLERVRFSYSGSPKGLQINSLVIRPGEKIGVIGPVGSGKSTLLRLLSGMYLPKEGRILLDGLDVSQISRPSLADRIGYIQQDQRLFSGSLRENLVFGMQDPGDEQIRAAAEKTGLLNVIAGHPQGLNLQIAEGGKGLSGGQRQQLAFTRLLLKMPDVWLLDEPTASMDALTEGACLKAMVESITDQNTMLLVTHKPTMLNLVSRIILVVNNQIVMDGPRDEVLARLSTNTQNAPSPAQ